MFLPRFLYFSVQRVSEEDIIRHIISLTNNQLQRIKRARNRIRESYRLLQSAFKEL